MNTETRQQLQRKHNRAIMTHRLTHWFNAIPTSPWKLIPLLLFFLAAFSAWQLKSHFLPTVIYSNPIWDWLHPKVPAILCILLSFSLFSVMLVGLSTPLSAKHYEQTLLKIGFTAYDGSPPVLIARNPIKHTKAHQLVFYSLGISKIAWEQRKTEIEDALNLTIVDIAYGGKHSNNRNLISLTTLSGTTNTKDLYDDEL